MNGYRVAPLGVAIDAVVEVPGSKSIANRALFCAALADGESVLSNVPDGDDTQSMLAALRTLGVEIEVIDQAQSGESEVISQQEWAPRGSTVRVVGGRSRFAPGPLTLQTGLAGTTSRFLTALCGLGKGAYTIDGEPSLRSRPMGPLHHAMEELGARVHPIGAAGHLPVTIEGPFDFSNDEVSLPGDVSSQFLTALMLVAPYFTAGLRFMLSTELVSRPYVRMTGSIMAHFGVPGVEVGDRIIVVPPGRYSAQHLVVEPDASSAGYPLAAAAICGGRVTVPGLTKESIQGDASFCHVLARMGCSVTQDDQATTVARSGPLRGLTINMVEHSDLVPTLAAVAAFADGATEIHGVGFIRNKESDRLGDLCAELRRAGVDAVDTADGMIINPGPVQMATLATHHDHRLAMAFALVGLGASGIVVDDPEVVSKSWPGYWSMIEGLR
ncbi:MAG: 3-phosphoshikimate 1-carboxyvinyltransferase [Actinomycetia bacterium]|nr:3-phosphoshikimate 1-carboxyvinyltransferase [Actinomycetes bacterium]